MNSHHHVIASFPRSLLRGQPDNIEIMGASFKTSTVESQVISRFADGIRRMGRAGRWRPGNFDGLGPSEGLSLWLSVGQCPCYDTWMIARELAILPCFATYHCGRATTGAPVYCILQFQKSSPDGWGTIHTMLLSFTIHLRIHKVFPIDHMSSENNPGYLGYIGDHSTQLYRDEHWCL